MFKLTDLKRVILTVFFVLVLLLTGFLIFNYQRLQGQSFKVENSIEGYKVRLVDKNATVNYLRSQGFLGENNIEKLEVVVAREVEEPFLVQNDKDGNMVISTSAKIVGNRALITIAVGDYIIEKVELEDMGKWLDSQFWKAINFLYKKASGSSRVDIESEGISIFTVEKT